MCSCRNALPHLGRATCSFHVAPACRHADWTISSPTMCKFVVSVWRVVSEDSDHGCDRPFLLIDCTGWIVTFMSFQHVGTTGYSVIPAYSQILLRQRLQP